ncbi:MAG: hypothetical protein U1E46_15880 [Hyphomicrobiales bacterium]
MRARPLLSLLLITIGLFAGEVHAAQFRYTVAGTELHVDMPVVATGLSSSKGDLLNSSDRGQQWVIRSVGSPVGPAWLAEESEPSPLIEMPIPPAALLFGLGVVGVGYLSRRRQAVKG